MVSYMESLTNQPVVMEIGAYPGEWHRFGNDSSAMEQFIWEKQLVCLDYVFSRIQQVQNSALCETIGHIQESCSGRSVSCR